MKSLVDPMPIITCSGKNKAGKMSTEITSRGYYSTKNVYYFGLKLHVVAFRRKGIIPFFLNCLYFPLRMKMTQLYCIQKSKVWEIRTIEKYMPIKYIQIYYSIKRRKNAKAIKGESPEITKREKVARDLFSTAVSKVRQLIESLFNWLNEKTNIQRAMKVRFTSGLLVHTMGKIAITLITLIFN